MSGRPAGLALTFLLCAGFLAGCNSSDSASSRPADRQTDGAVSAFRADPQLCRDLLDRSIDMVWPARLGITSDRRTAAGRLNDWRMQCGGAAATADPLSEFADRLPEDLRQRMDDEHYSGRDCDHVRNALLFRHVAEYATNGAATDVDQVVALFEHVVRSIELVARAPDDRPLTPFEIILFGKGTAEDQAWVFAEILRQMQLDAVILRPDHSGGAPGAADGEMADAPFLVGVLLEGGVYLFDFRLGLPLPAPDDDTSHLFPRTAATLEQATSDADVLASLNINGGMTYPVDAARLAEARVELIGNSSLWSARMSRLQSALSGEQSAVIYDPFWTDGPHAGTLARVVDAGQGRWERAAIGFWPYPEAQLTAFEALDEQRPQEIHRWLKAPFPVVRIEQTGQPVYGAPQNELVKTRIDHLLGEFNSVLVRYTGLRAVERGLITGVDPNTRRTLVIPESVRREVQQRVPPEYREVHRRAAEDAHYWLGLAQYQDGQYAGAIGTLKSYLSMHGSGSWAAAARELHAVCLAEEGRIANAVAGLRELLDRSPEYPRRQGLELLIRRWESASHAAQNSSAASRDRQGCPTCVPRWAGVPVLLSGRAPLR